MPTTIAQARDEMSAAFKACVDASSFANMVVMWDNVKDSPKPPQAPIPWARFAIKHNDGTQASLSGVDGRKRWKRIGIIVVQVFTATGPGLVSNDSVVATILAAYEGKTTPGGIWFRKGRFQEVGQSGDFFQSNIFVDFEYDEFK